MDRTYVSEFTQFINRFLEKHPEVVQDQWAGREIYWDKKVDFSDQKKAGKDFVPDDTYGFHYTASVGNPKHQSFPAQASKGPGEEMVVPSSGELPAKETVDAVASGSGGLGSSG